MRNHIPLSFPPTRKALWSHAYSGKPITLECPSVGVSITEQVLYLAHGQSRTGKTEACFFCGDLRIEPDCSEIVLLIDQLESTNTDNNIQAAVSDVRLPSKLIRKSRPECCPTFEQSDVQSSYWNLCDNVKSGAKIRLADFLSASAECVIFSGSNQIHCDVSLDVLVHATKFDIMPIDPVAVATTALSKSILTADKHGITSTQPKSGYLTMDQYRKVIFMLESDPKVLSVPIIGIWVSGVDLVTDPYIWASCVRYLHTSQVCDRVCKPSEPFLLIHKSPLMADPQFFDCTPASTALNFKLLSGGKGFSLEKEATAKRKGFLNFTLEHQNISTSKGRQFAEFVGSIIAPAEKENLVKQSNINRNDRELDDSFPRSSPAIHKPKDLTVRHSVPDISLLEEFNTHVAPRPDRMPLLQIAEQHFNASPITKACKLQEESIARKIMFEDNDDRKITNKENLTPDFPSRATGSSSQNLMLQSWGFKNPSLEKSHVSIDRDLALHTSPKSSTHDSKTLAPQNLTEQSKKTRNNQSYQSLMPMKLQNYATTQCPSGPLSHTEVHCCQCQQQSLDKSFTPHSPAAGNKGVALSTITGNVMRLLSANIPKQPPAPCNDYPHSEQETSVSPIDCVRNQSPFTLCTPPPAAVNNAINGVSPEVQQLLKEQDMQLKALQLQIQKLLEIQENKVTKHSVETQTPPLTQSATVNTGASLIECPHDVLEDSNNNSSTSQSLIQHDLTTLELPTQVTARSFVSDLNVDYDSFEESPVGSPHRDERSSPSDASWQSPVLGESVSMIAENMQSDSNQQQLSLIVKNVKQLLSKQITNISKSQSELTVKDRQTDSDDDEIPKGPTSNMESYNFLSGSDEEHYDEEIVLTDTAPCRSPLKAEDVASATRKQLTKMGVDSGPSPVLRNAAVGLPKLEYISLMMSESLISESNKSMELNALALKYLQDDQLTELAQLTVNKAKQDPKCQTSLLKQVLKINRTSTFESGNISFATKQYLRRYALTNTSHHSSITSHQMAPEVQSCVPPPQLKSILRGNPRLTPSQKAEKLEDKPLQVLDIARLKELPKLL